MYENLWQYIDTLDKEGEIVEIKALVDPVYEIAEITDRVSKSTGGGRALLFTNTGTDYPVLTNLYGSDKRIALALGSSSIDDVASRLRKFLKEITSPKDNIYKKIKTIPLLKDAASWMPRKLKGQGICQELTVEGGLNALPILKCWPRDGGRFITLPMVITQDPVSGMRNMGMYRMQVFSDNTMGLHWHMHKTGAKHYEMYNKLGKKMPVAVCIGGDPVLAYSATAPLPENIDELLLAGYLRRKRVELVKCRTNDLYVPSDCDFVIEGYVDTAEEKTVEGPFGDHTGFYSLEDKYPLFHVTRITSKRFPVYPATIVGIPPQEDFYIAKATEKIFLEPIRLVVQPEVRDLYMPPEGVAHNFAILDIDKRYPGQAFKTASAMWGAGQMMFNKFMVITGNESPVSHLGKTISKQKKKSLVSYSVLRNREYLWRSIENIRIPRDLMFSKGPLDVLDHTSDVIGVGGKLCIDATDKNQERYNDSPLKPVVLPEKWELGETVSEVIDFYAKDWRTLFVSVRKSKSETKDVACEISGMLAKNSVENLSFVFIYDENAFIRFRENHSVVKTLSKLLWLAGGNCDAVRDTVVVGNTLYIDARVKAGGINGFARHFPNVVISDKETIERVDIRWSDYGLGEFIPSPSHEFAALVPEGSDSASIN